MTKSWFIYLPVIIVLVGVVCLVLEQGRRPQAAPIAIQFTSKIGSFPGEGPFPPGAKFWVTNHTAKTLLVALRNIEARQGSEWTFHSALSIPPFTLAPHAGVCANIEPATYPLGAWRIKSTAQEKLTGLRRIWAAASVMLHGPRLGTSVGPSPFSTNWTYYGRPILGIPSQEVPDH